MSMSLERMLRMRILLTGILALAPAALVAQAPVVPSDRARAMATRAELETLAASAEGNEKAIVQSRLTEGDFQPGDLVALSVIEDETLTDTFTIRAGRTLKLPNIPEMSLQGVLRSELDSVLTARIAEGSKGLTAVESTAKVTSGRLTRMLSPLGVWVTSTPDPAVDSFSSLICWSIL